MKKIIGYGYRLSNETVDDALTLYGGYSGLLKSREAVKKEIARDFSLKNIHYNAKPKIFRVVIEYVGE